METTALLRQRNYRAANRDKVNANKRRWRGENRDKEARYRKKNYEKHREVNRMRALEYYHTHKSERATYAKHYMKRPEVRARGPANHLKYNYGISIDAFERIKKWQGNACAICGNVTKLNVDHRHRDGQIRGLLCLKCNTGLGAFSDSVAVLESAIQYLKMHG
jgi:hypothetical protein